MTVESTISKSGPYAGAGSPGPFPVDFRFLDQTHLRVIKTSTINVDSDLTLTTDYTVAGVGAPTGSVTLTAPLAAGQKLTIVRDVPTTQEADYVQNDAFPAQSHEDALDKVTMLAQQQQEVLDRALTLPPAVTGVSTQLPAPAANSLIGWNPAATGLQNMDPSTIATVVAFGTARADLFNGNGILTSFTLAANPGAEANLDVSIGGVTQRPDIDYNWTSGTTLVFASAPPIGANNVLVRYLQGLPQGVSDSAASQFIQAGVGAVLGNAQDELRSTIRPEQFGAVGDGVTDDTLALNKWATALATSSANGKCQSKTYRVSQAGLGVIFQNLTAKRIDFNKAVFKTLDGNLVADNQAGLMFRNCVDCDFVGFIYDANRAARTPAEKYTHSVNIGEGMLRCRFWSCRSINAVCDAWYVCPTSVNDLTKYPTDIHLHDCDGFNSYRNNLSLIGSVRFRMFGGSLNGATGTLPQAGFDVEPDAGTVYANDQYEFHNVETSDNLGYGRQYGGPIENTNGKDVGARGRNNAQGLMNISRAKGLEVINAKCGPHTTATRSMIDIGSTAIDVRVINPSFRDITAPETKSCLYVHSGAIGTVIQNLYAKTVSCPVLNGNGPLSLRGVNVDGCTAAANPTINLSGANIEAANINVKNSANRVYVAGANTTLTNISVEDCSLAGGFGAIEFDTSATGSTLRGAKINQTGGVVPAGQIGVRALCAMNEMSGIEGYGGYTTANVLTITAANAANTKMFGINPDPLTVTLATAGGAFATGHHYINAVSIPIASIGTPVLLAVDVNPLELQFHAQVYQVGGNNVSGYWENNTGASVTLAAGNFKFRAIKA